MKGDLFDRVGFFPARLNLNEVGKFCLLNAVLAWLEGILRAQNIRLRIFKPVTSHTIVGRPQTVKKKRKEADNNNNCPELTFLL
jgi:hypothetical protein